MALPPLKSLGLGRINMENQLIFRLLTLLLIISFVGHRGYYTRKYSQENGGESEEPEGSKAGSLLFILALVATVVYLVNPVWMSWAALPLPLWLRWVGVGLALSGFALLQWAQNTLGANWSDAPQMLEGQVMVTGGPYRWVRHPIYSAFLLILGSTLLITANWFIGLMWIGSTSIEVIARVRFEELLMLDRFDEQYRDYMQETGRLIPRLVR